jgi:glucose-6-phosphate 1-dehydrogenase
MKSNCLISEKTLCEYRQYLAVPTASYEQLFSLIEKNVRSRTRTRLTEEKTPGGLHCKSQHKLNPFERLLKQKQY